MTPPHPKRWLILFVILAAECMDLLDGTVVNVAAPTIHRDLHASSAALQWIVGGYPLALAVGLLIGGRLGDLYGRRRLFLIGVTGFTLASTVCGLAPSTGVLIGARLVQGVAGALMLPQGFGVLREVFPAEEIPKAFGLFGPVLGSAAMIGPILGGGLIALNLFSSGWRLVFLINLPLGVAALSGARVLLPTIRERHAARLDVGGALLASVAAIAIVYPLIQGHSLGWPVWTYVSMGAGGMLFALFGWHLQRRARAGGDPLVEPSVLRHRGFTGGMAVMTLYFGAMVGSMLAVTLFLQLGEGFSAIHAGLTLAPFALGTAITAPLAATKLAPRFGRGVIQAGGLISLLGYAGVALVVGQGASASSWALLGPLLVVGMGMGLFVVAVFDTILAAVTDAETGSASGILNAIQQLGGAAGVAGLGTVFFTALTHHGFAGALQHTMWWTVGVMAAMLAVSPLLPRRAREASIPGLPPAPDTSAAGHPPKLRQGRNGPAAAQPATALSASPRSARAAARRRRR